MKNILDTLQVISNQVSIFFTQILQKPDSITQFIVRIILFVIVIFIMLVILGFTGLLENPIGL